VRILGVFCFVFLLLTPLGFAQSLGNIPLKTYASTLYNSSSDVYEVYEYPNGSIYALVGGINGGLFSYDGQHWRKFLPRQEASYFTHMDSLGYFYSREKDSTIARISVSPEEKGFLKTRLKCPDTSAIELVSGGSLGQKSYFIGSRKSDESLHFFIHSPSSGSDSLVYYTKVPASFRYYSMLVKFNSELYFAKKDTLFQLGKNKIDTYLVFDLPEKTFILNAYSVSEGELLLLTGNSERQIKVYRYSFAEETTTYLATLPRAGSSLNRVYLTRISEGRWVYNTMQGGLHVLDKDFNTLEHLTTESGLPDDYVLGQSLDRAGGLWCATTNGLFRLDFASPLTSFQDNYGIKGSITSILQHKGRLYLTSTTGVFAEKKDGKGFVQLNEEDIECWGLVEKKDRLFMGAWRGTFEIKGETIEQVYANQNSAKDIALRDGEGSFGDYFLAIQSSRALKLCKVPENSKDELEFQELPDSLRTQGVFDVESLHGKFWLKTEEKNYATSLSLDENQQLTVKKYSLPEALPEHGTPSFFNFRGNVYLQQGNFFCTLDTTDNSFKEEKEFSSFFNEYKVLKMYFYPAGNNELWVNCLHNEGYSWFLVNEQGLPRIEPYTLSVLNDLEVKWAKPYFQGDSTVWIGTPQGLFKLQRDKLSGARAKFKTLITSLNTPKRTIFHPTALEGETTFAYRENSLRFEFAAPSFPAEEKVKFSFRLEPEMEDWSRWTKNTQKEFSNLLEGDYTLKVRAQNAFGQVGQTATFQFTVLPPWYRTPWMYGVYLLGLALFIWSIVWMNTRRLKQQKNILERKVEKRTQEIQQKNAELEQQKEEILIQAENLQELNEELGAQQTQLKDAHDVLRLKNQDITASIAYAERIQRAMLPAPTTLENSFAQTLLFWKPRDVVSGDFYWFYEGEKHSYWGAVDCTGHGVPGAFMAIVGSNLLTQIVQDAPQLLPGEVLSQLHSEVIRVLNQDKNENRDGMDAALLALSKNKETLYFSGAKNPLVIVRQGETEVIRGSRQSIGGVWTEEDTQRDFETHTLKPEASAWYVTFSDGFQDQFGGEKNKKYGRRRFYKLLEEAVQQTDPHDFIAAEFVRWQKQEEQLDDVLVFGVQLKA